MRAYIIAPTARIAEMVARGRPEITRKSDYRYVYNESEVWGHTSKDSGIEFLVYPGARGSSLSTAQYNALGYLRAKGITVIEVTEQELQP